MLIENISCTPGYLTCKQCSNPMYRVVCGYRDGNDITSTSNNQLVGPVCTRSKDRVSPAVRCLRIFILWIILDPVVLVRYKSSNSVTCFISVSQSYFKHKDRVAIPIPCPTILLLSFYSFFSYDLRGYT